MVDRFIHVTILFSVGLAFTQEDTPGNTVLSVLKPPEIASGYKKRGIGMNVLYALFGVVLLILFAFFGVWGLGWYTLFAVIIPYAAAATFVIGLVYRVVKWAKAPVPFHIPTVCGQQ